MNGEKVLFLALISRCTLYIDAIPNSARGPMIPSEFFMEFDPVERSFFAYIYNVIDEIFSWKNLTDGKTMTNGFYCTFNTAFHPLHRSRHFTGQIVVQEELDISMQNLQTGKEICMALSRKPERPKILCIFVFNITYEAQPKKLCYWFTGRLSYLAEGRFFNKTVCVDLKWSGRYITPDDCPYDYMDKPNHNLMRVNNVVLHVLTLIWACKLYVDVTTKEYYKPSLQAWKYFYELDPSWSTNIPIRTR
uniref:Vomeronasal type 2 receptor n=1 Tax=Romanomermis culicivorax TaxID=13658 RepID=A0A915KX06_ROMCU